MAIVHEPLPFLAADADLGPIIEHVEAILKPAGVNLLRVTYTYHEVVGYMCECVLAGIDVMSVEPEGDPLCLGPGDGALLAAYVRCHETAVTPVESEQAMTIGRLRHQLSQFPNSALDMPVRFEDDLNGRTVGIRAVRWHPEIGLTLVPDPAG